MAADEREKTESLDDGPASAALPPSHCYGATRRRGKVDRMDRMDRMDHGLARADTDRHRLAEGGVNGRWRMKSENEEGKAYLCVHV